MRCEPPAEHSGGGGASEPQRDFEWKCRAVRGRRENAATADERNHHQRSRDDAVHRHVGQLAHHRHDDEAAADAEHTCHQSGQRPGGRERGCGRPGPAKAASRRVDMRDAHRRLRLARRAARERLTQQPERDDQHHRGEQREQYALRQRMREARAGGGGGHTRGGHQQRGAIADEPLAERLERAHRCAAGHRDERDRRGLL
ncbi:hypothetical protein QFZ91_000579 [Paraburkholderia sp. JPY419]